MINLNKIGYTKKVPRALNVLTITALSRDYSFCSWWWLIIDSFWSIHNATELLVSKKKVAVPIIYSSCLLKTEICIMAAGGGNSVVETTDLCNNVNASESLCVLFM